MYRLLYLGFLMFFSLLSNGQQTVGHDTQRYKKAYKSILASSEFKKFRENQPCIVVFDSIVFQDRTSFLIELGQRWNYRGYEAEKRLLDSLDAIDRQARHNPYYSPLTANLTTNPAAKEECVVILFSALQKNTLLAEVSMNQSGKLTLHDILPMFNQTVRYLIFFKPNGKVQKYYTQVVSYN
jgi:hypothetical protein